MDSNGIWYKYSWSPEDEVHVSMKCSTKMMKMV